MRRECSFELVLQDLKLLAHGQEHVTAEGVIGLLSFALPQQQRSIRVRGQLEAVLRSMQEDELRKFLVFVTEIDHIPEGGLQNLNQLAEQGKIRVRIIEGTQRRPVAHTCFYELELPEYPSLEVLGSMLRDGFEQMDGVGFQMA